MDNLSQHRPKVFCLGLSRTGTTSLSLGLEKLGYRVIHFPLSFFVSEALSEGVAFRPRLNHGWRGRWQLRRQIRAARCTDARSVLEEYDGFSDLPVPLFFKQLDRLFPGAKFIHTTRDFESWLSSMKWLFEERPENWSEGPLIDELHYAIYGTSVYDREALMEAWSRYENELSVYFADRPSDFLKLRIDGGELDYGLICPFLERDLPDFPFPRVNQRVSPVTNL